MEYRDLNRNQKRIHAEMVNGRPFRTAGDIAVKLDLQEATVLKILSDQEFIDLVITARSGLSFRPKGEADPPELTT